MPPANDNWANATVLNDVPSHIGSATFQTTIGATVEVNEPTMPYFGGPPPTYSQQSVWYTYTLSAPTTNAFEIWFGTQGATAPMVVEVFIATPAPFLTSPPSLFNMRLVPFVRDDSTGVGYTYDAGVSISAIPGTQYWIRVSAKYNNNTGNFVLNFYPKVGFALGACNTCPPSIGTSICLEQKLATITIGDVNTNQQTTFGTFPPGNYRVKYCHGAFYAWSPDNPPGTIDVNQQDLGGWFVANQSLFLLGTGGDAFVILYPGTVVLYNHGPAYGTTDATFGLSRFDNLPAESPLNGGGYWIPLKGNSLASPVIYDPDYGLPVLDRDFNPYATLSPYPGQSSAELFALCAAASFTHYGGDILLDYRIYNYLAASDRVTLANGSPNPTWSLYQILPVLTAAGNAVTSIVSSTTTMNFSVQNSGEVAYAVSATLAGSLSSISPVPQTASLPTATTTPIAFSFTTPTADSTPVTLSFTDALGETFPVLNYMVIRHLLYVGTPVVVALPNFDGCGYTITQFTFPIFNGANYAASSSAQAVVTITAGPAMGVQQLTTCVWSGTSKTVALGAMAAESENASGVFIQGYAQPSGTTVTVTVQLTDGAYSAPPFTFNYTWP